MVLRSLTYPLGLPTIIEVPLPCVNFFWADEYIDWVYDIEERDRPFYMSGYPDDNGLFTVSFQTERGAALFKLRWL